MTIGMAIGLGSGRFCCSLWNRLWHEQIVVGIDALAIAVGLSISVGQQRVLLLQWKGRKRQTVSEMTFQMGLQGVYVLRELRMRHVYISISSLNFCCMRPTKITNIMQDAKTLCQRLFIIFIFIIIFLFRLYLVFFFSFNFHLWTSQ